MTGLVPIVLWFAAICIQDLVPSGDARPIVDNERVTVWDVTWTANTQPIRHQHDFVRVFVTGGTSSKKPGDVEFSRMGTAKKAGSGARTIETELKDHPVAPLPNTSGYPDAFPRPGVKKLIDNSRVTIWDVTWLPGVTTPMHFHGYDAIAVYLQDGALKAVTADGHGVVNEYFPGFTKFNPRNRIHSEQLVTGGSERAIVVDLK
ncbi:MAG TPA: hypothetical protein VKR43_00780 [Bryobacteraceae bacterium]|nr:hypothetical protein [Bryobacteraceae bacterium]